MTRRPTNERLDPVPLTDVSIDDGFWNDRLETNREVTLEHQYDRLGERSLENFRRVRDGKTGGFQGMWFEDSDTYKWLEAASYVLATRDDPELAERVEEVIELVAAAQEEDGYLNTYFTLEEPEKRWTNLHMMHELYCAGHLFEAAVAHYRATGEESLLAVATDFADHIDGVFGTGPDDLDGVPGHEGIELALVKLYRVTDEERYLDLAQYFVDRRGREDSRLEWETAHPEETGGDVPPDIFLDDGEWDGSYAQAHEPVREQETVDGHAVRAMYLYSGVADLVAETGEDDLYRTLETLWTNMTTKRMYVTGGIGSESAHEGFTVDYDLRNRTAYAETCAAIGSVFWNHRMFQLTGETRFYDVLERALYNGVLAGVSLDGTSFFYENPLESLGHHHRAGWFQCACCPPNVARLFASLGEYVYAQGPDDDVYVTLYVGGDADLSVDGADVTLTQETDYPWGDSTTVGIETETPVETALHLRVPEWCADVTASVNGERVEADAEDGFVVVERAWTDGDSVTLDFDLPVRRLAAHPDVPDDADRVAFQRGPLVYCVEETDLDGVAPSHLRVDPGSAVETREETDLLDGVVTIEGDARAVSTEGWEGALYREYDDLADDESAATLTAIPYYGWDNREEGRMRVWLPTD
ncbi:glycoside hydrolase family 127 protein (plasmid) [Halarchaeum sp. CBA1220]|uniref:glycoside hydrolase family 127 protein n=1 Tax=Halarchaeum sp. CBA1220 TaxID=1853682 RepID=UPI000F3A9E14|nr:beta-L-arabinofuranosidase domain-containing protein [Halarchaeum sp. CBA1220]QLC34802.1 glycoside hydrolase family 127 protein [Halarchaeum sp. CBA1220]